MTTNSATEPLARRLVRGGKSENEAKAIAKNAATLSARKPSRDEPMDKDSLLMQPTENWEASDKRAPGSKLVFMPTEAYKQNYDGIDWNDSG